MNVNISLVNALKLKMQLLLLLIESEPKVSAGFGQNSFLNVIFSGDDLCLQSPLKLHIQMVMNQLTN